MKKICVYGKGGIGKSTTVANVAAALAEEGLRVAVVGCDPKADSTRGLMGRRIPTVLDQLKTGASGEIAFTDSRGVRCIEAGGPEPGTGCAGRGIIVAMEEIRSRGLLDDRDVVLYDVLGDVVCGGFAMPLRGEYSDVVFVVTSGEMMSLYAASNIVRAVERFRSRGYARFGGYILNRRNVEGELENLEKLAAEEGGAIVADLPRSPDVQRAEAMGGTVVDALPESEMAACYCALAARVLEVCGHG